MVIKGETTAMADLLNKYISNGFADFKGLMITGSIPIKQEVVNELIAELLQKGINPSPTTLSGASPTPRLNLNVNDLLKFVKRAEVKADDGKITLDCEIRVD
jgi:hypothetical protein